MVSRAPLIPPHLRLPIPFLLGRRNVRIGCAGRQAPARHDALRSLPPDALVEAQIVDRVAQALCVTIVKVGGALAIGYAVRVDALPLAELVGARAFIAARATGIVDLPREKAAQNKITAGSPKRSEYFQSYA